MYQIYRNSQIIATVQNPAWIKSHPTEPVYIPAEPSEATGIAVAGVGVFALMGHELGGLEQVAVVEVDGGAIIDGMNAGMGHVAEFLDITMPGAMSEKEKAIVKTHRWVRQQFRQGMEWTDGNIYNVTERKQGFLKAQLQIGLLQIMAGADPADVTLQWNVSGRPHTDWSFPVLAQLASDIHNHVEPIVVRQQKAEERIIAAQTPEEIAEILEEFV